MILNSCLYVYWPFVSSLITFSTHFILNHLFLLSFCVYLYILEARYLSYEHCLLLLISSPFWLLWKNFLFLHNAICQLLYLSFVCILKDLILKKKSLLAPMSSSVLLRFSLFVSCLSFQSILSWFTGRAREGVKFQCFYGYPIFTAAFISKACF